MAVAFSEIAVAIAFITFTKAVITAFTSVPISKVGVDILSPIHYIYWYFLYVLVVVSKMPSSSKKDITQLPPEEKLKRLRSRVRRALKSIAKSLKNRGFDAFYVHDKATNDSYVILPLKSILKAIKRSISPEIRDYVGLTYVESEIQVNEGGIIKKVREPQLVFFIDLTPLEETAKKLKGAK